jgi:hypothetical protein
MVDTPKAAEMPPDAPAPAADSSKATAYQLWLSECPCPSWMRLGNKVKPCHEGCVAFQRWRSNQPSH